MSSKHSLEQAQGQHMFNVSYSLKHRDWLRKCYFSLVCSWVTASLGDLSIRHWKYQSPVKQVYWTANRFAFLYVATFCFCVLFVWQFVAITAWKWILSPCTQPSLLLFLLFCLMSHHLSMPFLPFTWIHARQFLQPSPFPAPVKCWAHFFSSCSVTEMGLHKALPLLLSPVLCMVLPGAAFLFKIISIFPP